MQRASAAVITGIELPSAMSSAPWKPSKPVAYILGCNLQLDLSAGQNLHGVSAAKPFVAAGVSVRADLFHRSTHPFDRLHGDRPAQSARI